jgi:membrane protease YdiL (CAAX protease family)
MRGHLRIKSPWSQLSIFLGLFGFFYIITGFISLFIYQSNGINALSLENINWKDSHVVNVFKWTQAFSTVLGFIPPAIVYALVTFSGNYGYFLGFRKAEKANMYILAVIGILLAMPFVFWLGALNQNIELPSKLIKLEEESTKIMTAFLKVNHTADILINVFVIALLPAIAEEICFRGALQRIIINITRNAWTGIVVTAILFSSLHMQFLGFLPRMFLGIVLGAFYWFSGSLWTSIIPHFVNNAVQVIVASYAPNYIDKNPETPVLAAIASGIVVWAILWYYQKQSTITYAKVYNTDDLTPTNQFMA